MDYVGVLLIVLVILPLFLFFLAVNVRFMRLALKLRKWERQQMARQANTTVTTISNGQLGTNEVSNSNNNNTTPKDDFPPAYDEVMQTYINAKLELQAQEESGAVGGGGMSAAVSSITIETEVDTTASANDLTVTSSTTTTTVPPDTQTQPPPYESPNGLRSKNDNVV